MRNFFLTHHVENKSLPCYCTQIDTYCCRGLRSAKGDAVSLVDCAFTTSGDTYLPTHQLIPEDLNLQLHSHMFCLGILLVTEHCEGGWIVVYADWFCLWVNMLLRWIRGSSCWSWRALGLLLQRPGSWRVWTRTQTLVKTSTSLHVVVGSASIQCLNLRPRGTNLKRWRKNCWNSWEVCGHCSGILILSKCMMLLYVHQSIYIISLDILHESVFHTQDLTFSQWWCWDFRSLSLGEEFFDIFTEHSAFIFKCQSV